VAFQVFDNEVVLKRKSPPIYPAAALAIVKFGNIRGSYGRIERGLDDSLPRGSGAIAS